MIAFFRIAGPFIGGVLFALGLGVSGMTEPYNIISFLNIFGKWKIDLLFVLLTSLAIYGVLSRLILRQSAPLFAKQFSLPLRTTIDFRLVFGAIIFGVGWGLSGLCPGPALVSLVSGKMQTIYFVLSMTLGMLVAMGFSRIKKL